MPMPGWWRKLNKNFFNPRAIRNDPDKWDMLTHTGRRSGATFITPMEVIPVPGGFVTFLMYGRNTDWAKNVLVTGTATLRTKHGKTYRLTNPRIVQLSDIDEEMPTEAFRPPGLLRVHELIRTDATEIA